MDRISQLPDAIQHQIILQLQKQDETLKSLIYFSLLSKSCYRSWLTYPHLAFTCLGYKKNYDDFIARVDRTLQRARSNGLNIDSFSVAYYPTCQSVHSNGLTLEGFSVGGCLKKPQDDLNRWLKCVIGFNVSVIDFHFRGSSNILFPFPLLSHVSTLRELRLRSCSLEFIDDGNSQDAGVVRLASLRKLRLDYIRHRGKTIEEIIRCCPLLEHLEIVSCFDAESLCISGVSKLQSILLCCTVFKELIIDAPCLRKFDCDWIVNRNPILSDASWSGLRKLCLRGHNALGPTKPEALLHHLEYLSLTNCYRNERPKILSLSIRVLHLVDCELRGALFIDCPRLCLFYYQDRNVPRIRRDSTFSRDCRFDLYLRELGYPDQDNVWLLADLRVFFFNTKINVTCLTLVLPHQVKLRLLPHQAWFTKGVYFHKEKVAQMPQPAELKYLKLKLTRSQEFPFVLLNLLLWIYHPDFIVFTFGEMDNDAQKVLLRSIRDIVTKKRTTPFECGCSDGKEVHECWHHSLRDVKLDWLGTTRGKDKDMDLESMDLDVIFQQVLQMHHGPINMRIRLALIWN